jgi:hypothetical protein
VRWVGVDGQERLLVRGQIVSHPYAVPDLAELVGRELVDQRRNVADCRAGAGLVASRSQLDAAGKAST